MHEERCKFNVAINELEQETTKLKFKVHELQSEYKKQESINTELSRKREVDGSLLDYHRHEIEERRQEVLAARLENEQLLEKLKASNDEKQTLQKIKNRLQTENEFLQIVSHEQVCYDSFPKNTSIIIISRTFS